MALKKYQSELLVFVNDDDFISTITAGFLDRATDKKAVFKRALECIFVKPRGVNVMPETKSLGISNREWQDFASLIIKYIKDNNAAQYSKFEQNSPLFQRYNKLWPACSEEITKDILALEGKVKEQQKIKDILNQNVK